MSHMSDYALASHIGANGTAPGTIPDKLEPHNVEAEEAVLGSLLIDHDGIAYVATFLQSSDFYIIRNGWVYQAILDLYRSGVPADQVTLADELGRRGQLEEIGGPVRLTELTLQTPTSTRLEYYANIVKENALERAWLKFFGDGARLVHEETNHSLKRERIKELLINNRLVSFVSLETWKLGNLETKTSWTADELLNANFPEPPMIVKGLIPVGLSLLAGKPKTGKSYLALQIAGAAGTGGQVLGIQVEKVPVLYVALEDNTARLKRRIKEQRWPAGADVTFELSWPQLNEGGAEKLDAEISRKGYKLVIIDTLSRAASFKQKDVEETTPVMSDLQHVAFNHSAGIFALDHHRKPGFTNVNDVINDVLGSVGKTAVADCIIGMYRAQGEKRAELKAVGRDQDFTDLTIEMAHDIMTWQLLGETQQVLTNERQQIVLDAIAHLGEEATHFNIAQLTGTLKGTLSKDLKAMADQGLIWKIGEGKGAYYQQKPGTIVF